jgi:hypothetical protein
MSDIYIVDKDGRPAFRELLMPFFNSLVGAFLNQANRIDIRADLASSVVEISYLVGNKIIPLTATPGFQPFVASSRIRIIAGIPIMSDSKIQTGKIRICSRERLLDVDVEIENSGSLEILRLKPNWN